MDLSQFCSRLNIALNGDDELPMYDIQWYQDEDGSHIYDSNCYLDVTNDTWSTNVFLDLLDEFGYTFDFTDNECDYILEEY